MMGLTGLQSGSGETGMDQSDHPLLFQINTRVWLRELSRELNRTVTLEDIPEEAIQDFARQGFKWIYLLGVWQTGEAARRVSLTDPGWRAEYQNILPDFSERDVPGSCFAVTGYSVHEGMGGNHAMERLRQRLKGHGLRLMLDFVPNHTAPDHPWVKDHPDYYIEGTEADLALEPQNYIRMQTVEGPRVLAYGRDPYFAGWQDTLQLDYSNPQLQSAMIEEMLSAAQFCDGLRCDMAMLVLPEIFGRTWGRQGQPFWPKAIEEVRGAHPGFVFMAEVYWDLEWTLQQQGFDYTYDKRLYDRLREGHAGPVRGHLQANPDYLYHMAHFLENHDEPRAAATFAPEVQPAAAIVTFFAPGLRFFHQGQFEGRKMRISVHLNRGPQEPDDPELHRFYMNLLNCLRTPLFKDGTWQILNASPAWEGNWTHDCFIAYHWQGPRSQQWLVVVNYAPNQAQCYLHLPMGKIKKKTIRFQDHMNPARYDRDKADLEANGLYLDLPPWGYHIFEVV
jgi:hypothetical protein